MGRFGDTVGSSGDVLGGFWELLEPLETPLGASGASQGGSWVLPERLREALGAPRTPSGASRGALGTFWSVFLGSEGALGAEKTEKLNSLFYLRNSQVFEAPVAPKACQNRLGVAPRGLVERAKVASSVFE